VIHTQVHDRSLCGYERAFRGRRTVMNNHATRIGQAGVGRSLVAH